MKDKPGVWFFSLDADSRVAVRGARLYFHLPYFDAKISMANRRGTIDYTCDRTNRNATPASWSATYRPIAPTFTAPVGSLVDWLTSRYCLYSADSKGRVFRGEIDHDPWPLQEAAADVRFNRMTDQIGITLPAVPPLLHYAKELQIIGWRPERAT